MAKHLYLSPRPITIIGRVTVLPYGISPSGRVPSCETLDNSATEKNRQAVEEIVVIPCNCSRDDSREKKKEPFVLVKYE